MFYQDSIIGDIAAKIFPSWEAIVVQLLATGVIFVVFYFFFWKKVKAMINKRKEYLDSQYTLADEKIKEAEKIKSEAETKELNSEVSKDKIQEDIDRELSKYKEDILKELQLRKENSLKDLEKSTDALKEKFFNELQEITIAITKKIYGKKLSDDEISEIVKKFIIDYKEYE
jgi:F-type H+-transporting ATPase subunit b